jgi:D-alanyl-D-alanine carboxypeptidase (penicillin-binding protein 5/6)
VTAGAPAARPRPASGVRRGRLARALLLVLLAVTAATPVLGPAASAAAARPPVAQGSGPPVPAASASASPVPVDRRSVVSLQAADDAATSEPSDPTAMTAGVELEGLQDPPSGWPEPALPELAAWILVDASTGQVLSESAGDVRRPVASTVKVLTALTALETLDLDDEVTVGDEVVDVEGSGVDIEAGETWTVEQLLDAVLARSGNDAAEALAVAAAGDRDSFVTRMEETAADLGVEGLELVSVSGLDDDNRLSARDLATIGRAALDDPRLRELVGRRTVVLPGTGEVETRNLLFERYPDATGIKTGFTLAAGNSLVASAARDDRELVAVVLGAGDDPARFDAAASLLDLGFDAFAPTTVTGELVLPVAGGEVVLVTPPVELTVPVDAEVVVELAVPVRPPTGRVIGALQVDDEELGEVVAEPDGGAAPLPVDGDGAVGRGLADGAWAALRAATTGGALG